MLRRGVSTNASALPMPTPITIARRRQAEPAAPP
jgi:hypothetical protein